MKGRAGMGRREVLRSGLTMGAGALLLSGISACGRQAPQAAPQRGPAPTVVSLAPWGGWPAYAGPHWREFIQPAMDAFAQKHPGLRIHVVAPGGGGSFVAEILAGSAPDVFQDWAIAQYRAGPLVLNLDRYIRQDNLSYSLWSPGQLNAMRDQAGTWFLPCYVHVDAWAVNQSALDALGLAYPSPDWTYQEATRLFTATTSNTGGHHRYGASLEFPGHTIGSPTGDSDSYIFHLFGGSMVDATLTRCEVGSAKSYQGVEWANQLLWAKVATSNSRDLAHVPFCEVGSNALVDYLLAWGNNFKWTFFSEPRFPAGQFAFEATDFYAINAQTKHPDAAWTVLRYLCADPTWSRYCMKYLLRTPSIVNLWPEYVATVEAVAPLVKGKGLHYFTESAAKWGVADRVFRYNHPQAISALNAQAQKAFQRQESVRLAMTQAAAQVDALVQAGAREIASGATAAKAFPVVGKQAIAKVTPGL